MKNEFLKVPTTNAGSGSSVAEQNTTDRDIKMYINVWDDVINKGKIDKINSTCFDENVIGIANPDNVVGIDAIKAYYKNYLTGFSNRSFEFIQVFGQDENIAKHWRFKGKHTGDFFGIPPTGKDVDIEGMSLVKMKNGRILQEQDFMDNLAFFSQLGVVSDPENISVINNLYKSFAEGDIPAVLEKMDPHIMWNEAEGNAYADGNPYIGPKTILDGVFIRLGKEWDNFKLVDLELHEMNNNKVLATLRYHGTYKDNGSKINAQVAHLWSLKNGKISAFQQYVVTKQLHEAITNH